MTEEQRFETVLAELGHLLIALVPIANHVVLIGGQALALEARSSTGSALIRVETNTGIAMERGYSLEPDLLLDVDQLGPMGEALPGILQQQGYRKVSTYRWLKVVGSVDVMLDLFTPDDSETEQLFGATRLPNASVALARPRHLRVQIAGQDCEFCVPSPVAFLKLKADAALDLRPDKDKDAFDIYAFVRLHGAEQVARALDQAPRDAPGLRRQLRQLFGDLDSKGVRDVLSYAASLDEDSKALVARDVVDLFQTVLGA